MRFEQLDCRQREVVKATLCSDANILVLGGPGSGKTTTALWAARTFLENPEQGATLRVLFLTFSRSAVSQIASRSPAVLTGRYRERIEILTFHSLAYRLLRAFGRYSGYGTLLPLVQSEARDKLLGVDENRLRYKDFMPRALNVIERNDRVRKLVSSRWGLVVCDEVQDTNPDQWRLLQTLAPRKLLLMGDANQLIYNFIPGVSLEHFHQMRNWVDREIQLNPQSHRDPSGAIPALAEAIRQRQFQDDAVRQALRSGRLVIHFDTDGEEVHSLLGKLVADAHRQGVRDIGIFAHSNAAVTKIGEQFDATGIENALVGIPEAHAEALAAMATQCAFGSGLANEREMRNSLGVFLTACVRGKKAPPLALALIGEEHIPRLEEAISRLQETLTEATNGNLETLAEAAMKSWKNLPVTSGHGPWRRAVAHFNRLLGPFRQLPVSEDSVKPLLEIVQLTRTDALIDLEYSGQGTVKLMNYHQTKGREADVVVHVFSPDDYFGKESEPYENASRLLNVAISRARQRVIVILPSAPHPLVKPFEALREAEILQ